MSYVDVGEAGRTALVSAAVCDGSVGLAIVLLESPARPQGQPPTQSLPFAVSIQCLWCLWAIQHIFNLSMMSGACLNTTD